MLLGIFAIYAALPGNWVAGRSDDFIYGQIGWWFVANMLLNGIWLPTFQSNTRVGFICAFIIMIALLTTCLYMETRVCNTELNVFEVIVLRSAMSIYAGWVGAATIISGTIMLKNLGMFASDRVDEPIFGVVMLWIALVLYCVNTYFNMDPLYGAVLIWACCAIRSNTDNSMIRTNLIFIIGIMSVYVVTITVLVLVQKFGK